MRRPRTWTETAARYRLYLVLGTDNRPGFTADTVRTYVAAADLFWRHSEGQVLRADRDHVRAYMAYQREHLSEATARNRLYALRSFFAWAVSEGLRHDNPTEGITLPKPRRKKLPPFTEDEMRRLLEGTRNPRDYALIMFLLTTGVRSGEACGVNVEDIDWQTGMIIIRKGKGRKQRWVCPEPAMLTMLKGIAFGRKGALWVTRTGKRLTPKYVRVNIMYRAAERAGVVGAHPHRCRRTHIVYLLRHGVDGGAVQSAVGHANLAETMAYADGDAEDRGLEAQRRMGLIGALRSA